MANSFKETKQQVKESNEKVVQVLSECGLTVSTFFTGCAAWAKENPGMFLAGSLSILVGLGTFTATLINVARTLKKLEDTEHRELTYSDFTSTLLKGLAGIGAVMTGLGLLGGVTDFALFRWSKEALQYFGRDPESQKKESKEVIATIRVAAAQFTMEGKLDEAELLFLKADLLERVNNGTATVYERMSASFEAFREHLGNMDNNTIIVGSVIIGTGVALLIAALSVYLSTPVYKLIKGKVIQELDVDVITEVFGDDKECIHVDTCPLKGTVHHTIDADHTCDLKCNGHNCIHFQGCVPKEIPKELSPAVMAKSPDGTVIIQAHSTKDDLIAKSIAENGYVVECIHHCGHHTSESACNHDCSGIFCSHFDDCKFKDKTTLVGKIKRRYEVHRPFDYTTSSVEMYEVDDVLDKLTTGYQNAKILGALRDISKSIELIFDLDFDWSKKENQSFLSSIVPLIPMDDFEADGSAYGLFARFEGGDKRTRGDRMFRAQAILAGLNPTTMEPVEKRAYIRDLLAERDAIEDYLSNGISRKFDPDGYNQRKQDAIDALDRIKEDLDAVYYAIEQAKNIVPRKGGRTGGKARGRDRKQVTRKEFFVGTILGAVALTKVDQHAITIAKLEEQIKTLQDAAILSGKDKVPGKVVKQPSPPAVKPEVKSYAAAVTESIPRGPSKKAVEKVVNPKCLHCLKHHKQGVCNRCKTVHCFAAGCVNKPVKEAVQPAPKEAGLEMATPIQPIPIKSNPYLFVLKNKDCPDTYGSKVKYNNAMYYLIQEHMFIDPNGTKYIVDGKAYVITKTMQDAALKLFKDGDIMLFPVNVFKVHPKVESLVISDSIGDSDTLSFYTTNVEGDFCICGVTKPTLTADKIYYGISTRNGSCGSLVIASRKNTHFLVGVHNGTQGGGENPNYSVRFVPK